MTDFRDGDLLATPSPLPRAAPKISILNRVNVRIAGYMGISPLTKNKGKPKGGAVSEK